MKESSLRRHPGLPSGPGLRVVLDADRILLDFEAAFRASARAALGYPVRQRSRVYALDVRYGLDRAQMSRVWSQIERDGWSGFAPMPGARALIAVLHAARADIRVATAIDPAFHAGRLLDLRRAGLDLAEEALVCVGHASSKEPLIARFAPHIVVDDDVVHINAAARQAVALPVWVHHGDPPREPPQWRDGQVRCVCTVHEAAGEVAIALGAMPHKPARQAGGSPSCGG